MKKILLKSFVIVLAVSILFAMTAMTCFAANSNAVKEARQGVVKIGVQLTFVIDGQTAQTGWVGSGALLATDKEATSTDLVLTAYHVIDDTFYVDDFFSEQNYYYEYFSQYDGWSMEDIPNITVDYFILLENDVRIGFTVDKNAKSQESDWALLHLNQKLSNIYALSLGSSSEIEVNDEVWALGFPALVETEFQTYTQEDVIVTKGILSKSEARIDGINASFLMHNATINGGNSGGPLVDENGNIIGINVKAWENNGASIGYNYATRIDDVRGVLDKLGIVYVSASDDGVPGWVIITVIAVLVVIAIVVVCIVIFAKKSKPSNVAAAPMASLHLVIQSGCLAGGRYRLTDRIAIGRDASQCNIVYPANTAGISGLHCEVFLQNGVVYLRDCKSSYGTYLGNGTKLEPGSTVMLGVGSVFYLAGPENTFMVQ